jgi:hypothetical protein
MDSEPTISMGRRPRFQAEFQDKCQAKIPQLQVMGMASSEFHAPFTT